MKIYLSHSTSMDYVKLYNAIDGIAGHEFILPHRGEAKNSKSIIKKCDALVADVSEPSLGVGIEVGWADSFNVPVIFMHKKESKVSGSIKFISKIVIEYENFGDARMKLENELKRI